jgi:hypothetical protein
MYRYPEATIRIYVCMYTDTPYHQIDIPEQTDMDVSLQCCMQISDDHFTIGLVLGLHQFWIFSILSTTRCKSSFLLSYMSYRHCHIVTCLWYLLLEVGRLMLWVWLHFHSHILFLCERRAPLAVGNMTPSKWGSVWIKHDWTIASIHALWWCWIACNT